jgi:MioC protein
MKILILVASMTGTAEMIAEDIRDAHPQHQWTILMAERATAAALEGVTDLLIVSSTYGQGEIPDPAKPLYAALDAARPDLSGLRYGVVALGDSNYPATFANGGRLWDALLARSGARAPVELVTLDASGPDDMSGLAVEWSVDWVRAIQCDAPVARAA